MISINDRLRDLALAQASSERIRSRGLAPGTTSPPPALCMRGALIVHNIWLLVTAELGLPGLGLWSWLVIASLWPPGLGISLAWRLWLSTVRSAWQGSLPPWIAHLVIGMFDYNPWPLALLSGAVLFSLLIAAVSVPERIPAPRSLVRQAGAASLTR